jgi:two-component system phosphate regulon response regulator PhoB
MQEKILLIEDAVDFQKLIEQTLNFKYKIDIAGSLAEARERLARNTYSLILLDVTLPDGLGFDFCRELQATNEHAMTPLIFLTGRTTISDKMIGLSAGAEDYLTKPFDPAELLLRVDHRITKSEKRKYHSENIQRGPLRLDLNSMAVYVAKDQNEVRLDLTPIEFKLLLKLAQNTHRVLSRQQLIDGVWGQGVYIEDRSIDKHISAIRKKLDSYGNSIKTVSGLGYEFHGQ